MVAREVGASPVTAREAGASPMMAREAVVARKDPVASTAAPVALGAAPVSSTAHGSGGVVGGGEVGRRRIGKTAAGWVEGFGGAVVAGGKWFFG